MKPGGTLLPEAPLFQVPQCHGFFQKCSSFTGSVSTAPFCHSWLSLLPPCPADAGTLLGSWLWPEAIISSTNALIHPLLWTECLFSPELYVEALRHDVILFGGKAFGRRLG